MGWIAFSALDPNPRPLGFVVIIGVNSLDLICLGMPTPVSETVMLTMPSFVKQATTTLPLDKSQHSPNIGTKMS